MLGLLRPLTSIKFFFGPTA